ncbi:putative uncharacterized protein DDB_G0282499 [Aphis gossypii]|uniref:putative uncharacterized protein DDB_G0282499 n=1 Tax=Aphis gossypii TaxID=80765 RepID=UPI002159507C|nr:putative uncharacterized protein DDB_G0282499 [Aphis gossypii]
MNTNYCGSCIIDIEDCDPLIIKTKNNNKNKMKIICFMFIILSCISFSLNRSIFNKKTQNDTEIELEQKNQVLMAGGLPAAEKIYDFLKTNFKQGNPTNNANNPVKCKNIKSSYNTNNKTNNNHKNNNYNITIINNNNYYNYYNSTSTEENT